MTGALIDILLGWHAARRAMCHWCRRVRGLRKKERAELAEKEEERTEVRQGEGEIEAEGHRRERGETRKGQRGTRENKKKNRERCQSSSEGH